MNTVLKRSIPIVLCLLLLLSLLTGCTAPETPETPSAAGRIKNIVLIIGDGMGPAQVQLGELALGEDFVFHNWQHTYCNTNSLSPLDKPTVTTDSAAGATALATGQLTKNGRVAMDAKGSKELKTILDYAKEYGKATGMVTTDDMHGATPGGFTGHAYNRSSTELILRSQFQSGVNLLCSNYTADTYNLAGPSGYTYCDDYKKIGDTMSADKVCWQFNMSGAFPRDPLETVATDALNFLSQGENGFVLVIEQAYIDKFSHSNDADGTQECVLSLHNTVQAVLDWIGDRNDTAILITADHETGGLTVSPDAIYDRHFTSDYGNIVYYQYTTTNHTDTMVDLYIHGFQPDFAAFSYDNDPQYIKNTAVFDIILDLLENPDQP